MSLIKANAVQVGQSPTATQNFTLAVPSSPDGTIKLARGNAGATTQDVISVDASGNVNGIVKSTNSTTSRSLANRFADVVNVLDFGAIGDGIADDRIAFQNAIATGKSVYIPDGTYNLTTGVILNANSTLVLIGSSKDKVKLISNIGTWMFIGVNNVVGVQFENITFDGRRVRDINGWPYSNPQTNNGSFRAIQIEATPGNDDTYALIDKCDFLNFSSLPIFFYFFYNVKVTNSKFYKTLDPGFVFCNNVIWSNNICEYIADNGVSMSRGNNNVIVESSVFKDTQGSGVWVSGFDILGTGTVTATGASYNVLDQVTLVSSTNLFSTNFVGSYVTQKSGSLEATYKINQFISPSNVIANCINAIDPVFQGTAISTWEYTPSRGPNNFVVSNNVIIGSYISGVHAPTGNINGKIDSNVIIRSGWCADSEITTSGSIPSGSNQLLLQNASNINVNDFIIVDPISSYRNYFIAKVINKIGNSITLSVNAPETYSNEVVKKIHTPPSTTSLGHHIIISGTTAGFPDSISANICASNNVMYDSASTNIKIYTRGPTENISVKNNSMFVAQSQPGDIPSINRHAVAIEEQTIVASPCKNIIISNNLYTGSGRILRMAQNGTSIRQYIICSDNVYPNGQRLRAFDVNTSVDLSSNYVTSFYDIYGRLNSDSISPKKIQFKSFATGTVVSGVMDVTQSTLLFGGTNPTTNITDFTKQTTDDLILFTLRNSNTGAGNTITLVQDFNKIRTQTGANLVLDAGESAIFVFINNTIVSQIG